MVASLTSAVARRVFREILCRSGVQKGLPPKMSTRGLISVRSLTSKRRLLGWFKESIYWERYYAGKEVWRLIYCGTSQDGAGVSQCTTPGQPNGND